MNTTLVHKITNYLARQPIDKAWLFGSYSREEETQKSDIDIMVTFSQGYKMTLFKYAHLINELQKITGKNIDLVEDGQLKKFAVQSAEQEKVLIYERKN